jgi:hypothetical protein
MDLLHSSGVPLLSWHVKHTLCAPSQHTRPVYKARSVLPQVTIPLSLSLLSLYFQICQPIMTQSSVPPSEDSPTKAPSNSAQWVARGAEVASECPTVLPQRVWTCFDTDSVLRNRLAGGQTDKMLVADSTHLRHYTKDGWASRNFSPQYAIHR